jgi:hypothetical protein
MTCRPFVEHLAEFLGGELAETLRQQAEAHLLECPDCQRYKFSCEVTVRLVRLAYDEESDSANNDILQDGVAVWRV